jgi:glycogen debranching enzyme
MSKPTLGRSRRASKVRTCTVAAQRYFQIRREAPGGRRGPRDRFSSGATFPSRRRKLSTERIRIGDHYYLLASALAPTRPRTLLNHGDSFAIFDVAGDVPLAGLEPFGLFHRGTRYLDRLELRFDKAFPLLLSSSASEDGAEIVAYLTNADERRGEELVLQRDTIGIQRNKTLVDGALFETFRFENFGSTAIEFEVGIQFGADFCDVFELRGVVRARRGETLAPLVENGGAARLGYVGLDGVRRETVVGFSPYPEEIVPNAAKFQFGLEPGAVRKVEMQVECREGGDGAIPASRRAAVGRVRSERERWSRQFPIIVSSSGSFNDWLDRSRADLAILRASRPEGDAVYAGIPWFATVFGRDALLTALETLAFAPAISAGVLRTLGALQGAKVVAERDEEPGKILHELRHGEMAALGEIPFGRYYGSVDSTPLFVWLLGEYCGRTGDLGLVDELWPVALGAMSWIDQYGDRDGDGYVEYARRGARGLVNQGWKDSHDAISHEDGQLAVPPIALAEVQGYVYAARMQMASLARRRGELDLAARFEAQAIRLRERFNREFWMSEHGTFALALDGEKRPCRVVTSNAGHCLATGLAESDKAKSVVERMMRRDVFSGFGVRTLSEREKRFNPMSYHNGSVWPHDNALCAAGFARYGATATAARVVTEGLLAASRGFEGRRLPELFCGFARDRWHGPVPYPVACQPQAWAAGSVFLLLQSLLGLTIDGFARRIVFERPAMPHAMSELEIRGLRVGEASVDLSLAQGHAGPTVEVSGQRGAVEVVVRS